MAKYRKKPVVVEAIQWNVPDENGKVKLAKDCKDHPKVRPTSYLEVSEMLGTAGCSQEQPYWDWSVMGVIDTLEGKHIVRPGDYIIKGVKGEFYPCKPDIFEMTYEKADSKNLNHRSKESIQFIAETAGVDEETVVKVLQAEDEYISYILKVISGGKSEVEP